VRLCLVSREFPPFVGGGIGAYTLRLARELARRAHEVVVVTVSTDGSRAREHADGFTVVRLPLVVGDDWSRPAAAIASPEIDAAFRAFHPVSVFAMQLEREIPRLHEEFAFDVIEFPDCGAPGWFLLNARRNAGLETPPVVVFLHSPTAWINELNRDPSIDPPTRHLIAMEHDCIRWADGLVSPSAGLARWIERQGLLPPGRIEHVPLPLGELEAAPRARPARGGRRRLLYAGRLEPRKGVDLLVEGTRRALETGVDLHLDLYGRDVHDARTGRGFGASAWNRLPEAARDRVWLHGQVDPDALRRIPADAAVIPSPDDNFPYTCVEAMARGLPVVATRAGGMAEMIRDGTDGLLVEPEADAWGDALRRVARMSRWRLRRMGASARTRIRRLCSNTDVVARRAQHVERVIAHASPADAPTPDREWVALNGPDPPPPELGRLVEAVCRGADAACGWERLPDGSVRALGPLTAEGLLLGGAPRGPVVVARDAGAAEPREDAPQSLLLRLALDGRPIAVVPGAVFDVPEDCTPPAPPAMQGLDKASLCRLARGLAPRIALGAEPPG